MVKILSCCLAPWKTKKGAIVVPLKVERTGVRNLAGAFAAEVVETGVAVEASLETLGLSDNETVEFLRDL